VSSRMSTQLFTRYHGVLQPGKSVLVVFFYHVLAGVQYKGSTTLTLVCLC